LRAIAVSNNKLTESQQAAIDGASSPGALNVFATMADVGGDPSDNSVDGGSASTTYLPTQLIDGGSA
jgi:hypothetical protein